MNKKITKNLTKNIDPKEIKRFNLSASQWWNTNGIFQSLHHINNTRLHYIIKYSNGLHKKKILDIGCGGGILSESMARKGAKVTGLDYSSNSLNIAKKHALSHNLIINYKLETIEQHLLNHTNHYDIITCMEVLEHVPNPLEIINACSSMIKIGGSIFFSTLNRTLKAWLLVIIGAEYIFNLIPKGTHTLERFITPSELLDWIDITKLEANNISGIYYNPFTYNCMITQDISVNYILHTQRTL
ncbi:3-demethylubiquinone-9 3-O-methyltransferase [Candidatus Blochmanniella vafra str. BVAF]|uniref:Ubiquinone biosynthesis O-methyltransferase n=1 Tax=Blochmanniella vafra (strain BVAF) TaxID=859654 RepID=E8Q740_BLOVB|nr:bifunctional 2-polyprenyl-6-hydroxyphenol methylase/3-demethylubiquinol 3-O-methyltransferase UbiG [Candidatus Blochmannia vafer]ADV33864.1 3-demethylubiquinone-9 3-O-methyltransferase [Candidatus Blochmannia vafer str. BVAF]